MANLTRVLALAHDLLNGSFNAGGGYADVWVRDIALKGPGDVFTSLDFDLVNDGQYVGYY